MVDIYTFDGRGDGGGNADQRTEDITIRIALQTIECCILILHYTSDAGRWLNDLFKILPSISYITQPDPQSQAIGDTVGIVLRLSGALMQLKAERGSRMKPPTPFVSARALQIVESHGIKVLFSWCTVDCP